MALTTVARVKEVLGLKTDDTTKDALIAELIERVSKEITSRTNRSMEYGSYTDYYNGDGKSKRLSLINFPVDATATFQLYDDTARAYDSTTLIDPTNYTVDYDNGIVSLDAGIPFLRGYKNIKVVYAAGYHTIPQDLESACIWTVAADFIETQGELKTEIGIEVANRIQKLRDRADKIIQSYKSPMLGRGYGWTTPAYYR